MTKSNAKFLTSGLKEWNLLHSSYQAIAARNGHEIPQHSFR